METISNEEKAKEIMNKFYSNLMPHYTHNEVFNRCFRARYADILEAMQWKDNCVSGWIDILNKEIDKLTTGNLTHNKTHIKCLLYEIQKQLKGE